MHILSSIALSLLSLATLTLAAPGGRPPPHDSSHEHSNVPTSGSPVLPGYNADPNLFIANCTYYIYPTTDGIPGWGGQTFYVWSSPDLITWTRSAEPILTLNGSAGNVPWATGNAWAPTITAKDGKYYFYFSGANPEYDGDKTIGVAVADSPEGPFTAEAQPMIRNLPSEGLTTDQAIDADAFLDPRSGKYFLYWGNGVPLVAELGEDMVSLVPDSTVEVEGLENFREGLFVVYREPYYHLTYSIDDTRSEDYRVGYATASEPKGPFTYRGVVLSKRPQLGILATGHDSVVNVPGTDEWLMAYHRFAIPGGNGTMREVVLDRVEFGNDGIMLPVVPTLEGVRERRVEGCGCD